jgi:hypothetical protein
MTTVPLLEAERLTVRRAGRAVLDVAVAGGDMVALYGPPGPATRRCSRCRRRAGAGRELPRALDPEAAQDLVAGSLVTWVDDPDLHEDDVCMILGPGAERVEAGRATFPR